MKRKTRLVLLLMAAMPGAAWTEEPVYFPDAHLKEAVEQTLRKTDPTPTDMLSE